MFIVGVTVYFCALQRCYITVLVVGLVSTVAARVTALLGLMSVGQRTDAVLTVFVNLAGPIHLTVRPVGTKVFLSVRYFRILVSCISRDF